MPERTPLPRPLDVAPRIAPPFDPGFRPMILAYRAYRAAARPEDEVPVRVAIERENGLVSTFATRVSSDPSLAPATAFLVERIVKFLLWSRGGWKISFDGPRRDRRSDPGGLRGGRAAGFRCPNSWAASTRSRSRSSSSGRRSSRRPGKTGWPSAVTSTAAGSVSTSARATTRSPPSGTARPFTARRSPGRRATRPTRPIITTTSGTA